MKKFFQNFLREEEGQGMSEYALVLGVIAVGVVAVLLVFGEQIVNQFQKIIDIFQNETEEL